MLISFFCPQCVAKLEIEATAVGTRVQCPQCQNMVTIPPKPLGPGVTIGGFKIKQLLGRGAMGAVYLAHQVSMDRDVALKILPPSITRDKHAVEMFLQEVRLQAKLEHPNIVTAHEAGEDNGVYYLAMAYVGESLAARLERQKSIPEKEALEIILKLAGALDYAWAEHRLLHRDIKPANIVMDLHGHPRLTDLGLSTSLRHAGVLATEQWIVGTPNYMSPEQGAGGVEIDFRADIYSLGTTLYHLLTGQLPFDGNSPEEIFQLQAEEPLTDPRELNADISEPCVELLALMLAKNRDQRHPSWSALIGDIERAIAGEHPSKTPLGPGESAMLRVRAMGGNALLDHKKIVLRHSQVKKLQDRAVLPREKGGSWLGLMVGGVLLIALLAGFLVVRQWLAVKPPAPVVAVKENAPPAPVPQAIEPEISPFERQFAEAVRYEQEHPDDLDGAMRWFGQVQDAGKGTEFEIRAGNELRRLAAAREKAVEAVVTRLKTQAEQLLAENNLAQASTLLLNYAGAYAADTLEVRKTLEADLVRRVAEAEKARQEQVEAAQARLDALVGAVADDLLKLDFAQASSRIEEAVAGGGYPPPVDQALQSLRELCGKVAAMPQVILDSFRANQGREVMVDFMSGPQLLKIGTVGSDGAIRAQRNFGGAGYAQRNFRVDELAFQERFERLGKEVVPDLDIMRGLIANQWQKEAVAERFFQRAGGLLGDELAQRVGRKMAGARELEAEKAFANLLRIAGLPPNAGATDEVLRSVRRKSYPAADVARIREAASKFRQSYGDSEKASQAAGLLTVLERVDTVPREVDQAILDQAIKRLKSENPQVSEMTFLHDVNNEGIEMDLSNNPELSTIAALERLPLTKLNLSKTKVGDLSALRMMPLRILDLSGCPVDDIQILEGMPLEDLNLSGCKVRSVRPLKGAPLRTLILAGNPVNIISTLSDMPIVKLDLGGCPVADVRPLRTVPLEWLSLWKTKIPDLKPLKGMALKTLSVAGTAVTDLSPLEGMPLESLNVSWTGVTNLTPLSALPLRELSLDMCGGLSDLRPLAGMSLTHLYISSTHVTDLSPLQGMPLHTLSIPGTRIQDFSPLKGMTTLQMIHWNPWDRVQFILPISKAIEAGDYDTAIQRARTLAGELEGIPAFAPFAGLLKTLAEQRIPDFKKSSADPQNIRSMAKAFKKNHYALGPGYADFNEAVAFCRSVGGTLAAVASKEELDWMVANFALPGIPIRLGGTDAKREGDWQWVSGEPWVFAHWLGGQPDNSRKAQHSLVFYWDGRWDDIEPEVKCPFLIKWTGP